MREICIGELYAKERRSEVEEREVRVRGEMKALPDLSCPKYRQRSP